MSMIRIFKLLRRQIRRGFTLIELSIVGLFLGLLAVFAISAFNGSAADNTRANAMYEAALKVSAAWSAIALQCGLDTNIEGALVGSGGASTTAGKNLSLILGTAPADAGYAACVQNSIARPLTGIAEGSAGSEKVHGYPITVGSATVLGRTVMKVMYNNVPENVFVRLYQKRSTDSAAATTEPVASQSDTLDPQFRYTANTGGQRQVTLLMGL